MYSSYAPPPSVVGSSPYIRRITSPAGSPKRTCCYGHPPRTPPPPTTPTIGSAPAAGGSFLCCCYTCPRRTNSSTSVLATLAICCLVLGYTILGAFVFMALEGGAVNTSGFVLQHHQHHPESSVAASKADPSNLNSLNTNPPLPTLTTSTTTAKSSLKSSQNPPMSVGELRAQTVDRLWSITENLNILYRENWTRLAAEEVLEFQEALLRALRNGGGGYINDGTYLYHHQPHRWTFSSSFLYSLTLITTIGYGSVAPRTSWGKLVTIIYALIGIPLMLLYLSTTGDVLARTFRRIYGKLCGGGSNITDRKTNGDAASCPCSARRIKVPVTLCLLIMLAYICTGALLFQRLENWSLLEGSYFCFTSLGTIGFGDLLPGARQRRRTAEELSLCACAAYIIAGMALVAMCFSLVQDEVLHLLRLVGATCSSRHEAHTLADEEDAS